MAAPPPPPRTTFGSYFQPSSSSIRTTITRPAVEARNFEIKPALVNLVSQNQFGGSPVEDPNLHLENFLALCDTVMIQGIPADAIRLVLFKFSLRDRALDWLRSLPSGSINTWEDCVSKFLAKFFPPSKIAKLRAEIINFKQKNDENIHDSWERFKELLRKCPQHALPDWMQLQCFIDGLDANTKGVIDASAGGSINNKTIEELSDLIEMISESHCHIERDRKVEAKGIFELDTMNAILAQNKLLTQQMAVISKQMEALKPSETVMENVCTICGNSHIDGACLFADEAVAQQCNYMGNFPKQQFQNNVQGKFGQGWRNYPQNAWRGGSQFQAISQGEGSGSAPNPTPLEVALEKLTSHTSTFIQQTTSFMDETRTNQKNLEASLKNFETQLGQLAKQVAERPTGKFPSNTEGPM